MSSAPEPKLTLTYFGIAGRAEPIRIACAIGNIPFTNKVISGNFMQIKPTLPLGQLPILDMEYGEGKNKTLTQSSAILRYIGKKAGLYPKDDDVRAMEIDEVLAVIEDLRTPLILTIRGAVKSHLSDEKQFTKDEVLEIRRRWRETLVPKTLGFLEKKLTENSGSDWIVGDNISIADLELYCSLDYISSGILDGVPTDILEPFSACKKLMENVKNNEGVKKWTDNYSKPYGTFDFKALN